MRVPPPRLTSPRAIAQLFSDLPTRIKRCARDAGFDLCGIAPVRDFGELHDFPPWIADGKHGEMKYMEERDETGELKRASLARVAPWARSVVVCAINYNTAHPYSTQAQSEDASRGWISRYAWSREDYHDAVLRRLQKIEDELRSLLDATDHWPLTTVSVPMSTPARSSSAYSPSTQASDGSARTLASSTSSWDRGCF